MKRRDMVENMYKMKPKKRRARTGTGTCTQRTHSSPRETPTERINERDVERWGEECTAKMTGQPEWKKSDA